MKEIERSEQQKDNTWNLTKIYKNEKEFYKEVELVEKMIDEYQKYQGHILENGNNLYEVLKLDTNISTILDKLATYSYRLLDEDISNTNSQKLKGKVDLLFNYASSKFSYIIPELLKSDFKTIENLINENKNLEEYRLVLKQIFRFKDHTLSSNEEKVIAELSNITSSASRIASIIRNAELPFTTIKDSNGKDVELNNENYSIFIKDKDRRVRKEAFLGIYSSYEKFKNTFTETIQSHVSKNAKLSKLKNYSSSKEASLFSNYVTIEPYNNLIKTINDNLDVLYKYFKLKKEVSGLSDYSLYDTYLNLASASDKTYSFEEAKKIILDVVKVLGDDYVSKVNRAFNERWIDIYPNKNKRGGAYSSGCKGTAPYILLNYQNTFRDVSTLIHELGHSMHSLYTWENNLPQYADYKIFVAEVASTVNEMLLNDYMLKHSDSKKEKMFIISEAMDNFKATLYRQTMFSEFEEFMHDEVEKGTVLTSDFLCEKYYELNKKYFGDDVIVNDEIKYEWMRIPHFYYNFYVYQYATGISCACYIVNRILSGDKNAVSDYLKFLSCGNTLDPIESLKVAGVDITKSEVIQSAVDTFNSLIEEYRTLMNEK